MARPPLQPTPHLPSYHEQHRFWPNNVLHDKLPLAPGVLDVAGVAEVQAHVQAHDARTSLPACRRNRAHTCLCPHLHTCLHTCLPRRPHPYLLMSPYTCPLACLTTYQLMCLLMCLHTYHHTYLHTCAPNGRTHLHTCLQPDCTHIHQRAYSHACTHVHSYMTACVQHAQTRGKAAAAGRSGYPQA